MRSFLFGGIGAGGPVSVSRVLKSRWGLVAVLVADFLLFGGPHRPREAYRTAVAEARAAQVVTNDRWLGLEGVVGTAIGVDPQGRLVVKVYLTAPGAALLPSRVEGVPLDVEVTGPFVALGDPPLATVERQDDAPVDPKKTFPRPVPIGVSTGHPGVSAGTIGARVTDGRRVFALSNNHVYANRNQGKRGDPLLQPGVHDGGKDPEDVIGTLFDFEPLRFCSGPRCPLNRIDAAIALTSTDDIGSQTPEGGYGNPRGKPAEAALGMEVQKYGRTTGHTRGRVTGIHATLEVDYRTGRVRFDEQIVISGQFSGPGDSGSLVVTDGVMLGDRRPVGLLFAGSSASTIANPIAPVLERFKVTVDGGED